MLNLKIKLIELSKVRIIFIIIRIYYLYIVLVEDIEVIRDKG